MRSPVGEKSGRKPAQNRYTGKTQRIFTGSKRDKKEACDGCGGKWSVLWGLKNADEHTLAATDAEGRPRFSGDRVERLDDGVLAENLPGPRASMLNCLRTKVK